ncbi:MAG: hypothetical protein ACPL7K_06925, partial [Armatimonadota bacterium]
NTMIDALHKACWYRHQNNTTALAQHLAATYGNRDSFWQVAQAISEVLPAGDKEKGLLQGLLYGKDTYVARAPEQESPRLDL